MKEATAVSMSDRLSFWVFKSHPGWILELQPDLAAEAAGDAAGAAGSAGVYRFSAPVLKEREYRLDGLLLPTPQRCDQRRTGVRHQGPVAGAIRGLGRRRSLLRRSCPAGFEEPSGSGGLAGGGLISGRSGARPMQPALLDRHPMHQFWPDGLSLLNKSDIDA